MFLVLSYRKSFLLVPNVACILFLGQVRDLADKLESWDHNMSRGSYAIEREGSDKKTEDKLSKATKDSCKITTEVLHGIMTQVVKDKLFNCIQK